MLNIDPALIQDVDLLCLDAGNTVVFLDHARLAQSCAKAGFATTAGALVRSEGEAKIAVEQDQGVAVPWAMVHVKAAYGWGVVVGTMLHLAGLAKESIAGVLDVLWPEHEEHNFWSIVPEGLLEALVRARTHGVRIAVISNSEGKLERLFDKLGISRCMDLVVDSGIVGIEKPDPRIFSIALDHFDVSPARALHLGDTYASDVVGARAAGLRVALVDPHQHFKGRHADVPRVPGAQEVATAMAVARSTGGLA